MQHRLVSALCVLGFTILVPGCQKALNLEKTLTLTVGAVEVPAIVTAPRGEQKIRVGVTSAEPINVDVVLEADRAALTETLLSGKRPATGKTLASKEQVKSDTVTATVPAGKDYAVVLSGAAKSTEVKVTVKSE